MNRPTTPQGLIRVHRVGPQPFKPAWANAFAVISAILMIPAFMQLGIHASVSVPLAVLMGLSLAQLFSFVSSSSGADIFMPLSLVAGYFLSYFCMRCYALCVDPFFRRAGLVYYDDYLPQAMWCAVLGYALLLAGFHSPVASKAIKRLPRTIASWPVHIPAIRLMTLAAAAFVSLVYLFKIGVTVGNYANREFQRNPPPGLPVLLVDAVDLVWIAVLIFLIIPRKPGNRTIAVFLLPVCLGLIVMRLGISGGKVALIQPALEAAIVLHYGWRRLRVWEIVAVGLPLLFVAFGVINFYRFVVVGQHGAPKSLSDVFERVSSAAQLLSSSKQPALKKSALDQMLERSAGVDSMALIMKYTPHPYGYAHGRDLLTVPVAFIPRQLWKGKPINKATLEFEYNYMGQSANYVGFSSMHLIADMYRNFGYFGVIAGMFVIGILLRGLYLFCAPSKSNLPGLFLYAAIFPNLIHSFEGDSASEINQLIRMLLLVVISAYFLGIRFRWVSARATKRPLGLPMPLPATPILEGM